MAQAVVTVTFEVTWDIDECRTEWEEPNMTDEEVLAECLQSANDDWRAYSLVADVVNVEGTLA